MTYVSSIAARSRAALALAVPALLFASTARADEPLTLNATWEGAYDFFATGAPLAVDGPDDGEQVDMLSQPATTSITDVDVIPGGAVIEAFLYWGGSVPNTDCGGGNIDDEVTFTAPGGMPTPVVADECYCSDGGAQGYDIQACRAQVGDLIEEMIGDYTVDGFDALIENGDTNNASFSIVIVYNHEFLRPRRIGLYDGLLTLWANGTDQLALELDGLDADDPPEGDLTWYVMEGDVGGSMNEQVTIEGSPGGKSVTLSDGINPADNPMNHTINTTAPVQSDTIGVDIDRFDVKDALTAGDDAVTITYEAGLDKWWIVYNIVGINVFKAVLLNSSSKTWALESDADGNGVPSPGDTVRYTLHFENSGSATGVASISDPIPPEAESWAVVDAAGANDVSNADTLLLESLTIDDGASADVTFDVVIADVPDETEMNNTAEFDATPDGDAGSIMADPVLIRRDGDGDAVFDNDDNCPDAPNPDQADSDNDGTGDACDPDGTTSGTTAGPTTTGNSGSETGPNETDASTGPQTTDATQGVTSGDTEGASTTPGEEDEGCGCATGASDPAAGLALLLLLGLRRRRD